MVDGSVKLQTFILKFNTTIYCKTFLILDNCSPLLHPELLSSSDPSFVWAEVEIDLLGAKLAENTEEIVEQRRSWCEGWPVASDVEKFKSLSSNWTIGRIIRVTFVPFINLSVDFDLVKCQDSINFHQSELSRYFIHNVSHDHKAWSAKCKVDLYSNILKIIFYGSLTNKICPL